MSILRIDTLDHPSLVPYRSLKNSVPERFRHTFIVEGQKLVERLIASRFAVESLLVDEEWLDTLHPGLALDPAIPIYVAAPGLLNDIVGFPFHQGVLASGVRSPWPTLSELLAPTSAPRALLVAPQVDNPENLGSLLRLADVFGFDALVLGDRAPDPYSRRVLRVSMGMALRVPVVTISDFEALFTNFRGPLAIRSYATTISPTATHFDQVDWPSRLALVMGSEAHGLDPRWAAACDEHVTIPMRPSADSLNLAVAAGILMYSASRRPSNSPLSPE